MLKSVLVKLIECMNKRNRYVRQDRTEFAKQYSKYCHLLLECLDDAGYLYRISFAKHLNSREPLYTCVEVDVPGILAHDIKAFDAAGFEWIREQCKMIYKFDENRKEDEIV